LKLIPNWRNALRMFSVQANTANVAMLASWASLPARIQDAIPTGAVIALAITLLVLGTIGRLIAQPAVQAGD
jgi:hypothetical protein